MRVCISQASPRVICAGDLRTTLSIARGSIIYVGSNWEKRKEALISYPRNIPLSFQLAQTENLSFGHDLEKNPWKARSTSPQ